MKSARPPFRARRGKQGLGAWGAEEHRRHEAGLKPRKGDTAAMRKARRGGID